MFRVSRFFALVVLAVWFSATQHCELADLGWPSTEEASQAADKDCTKDSCAQVENGSYRVQNEAIKAPAPTLIALDPMDSFAAAIVLTLLPREASPQLSAAAERPQNWVTTWHFVRRAAPPSRAPALLCA